MAARADLDGDRVIDALDVEILEALNGLPDTLSGAMRAIDRRRSSSNGRCSTFPRPRREPRPEFPGRPEQWIPPPATG